MAQLKQHTFLTSAARTASVNASGHRVDGFTRCSIYLDITAVSGTTPTLDVAVEVSDDNVAWFPVKVPPDITEAMAIAQANSVSMDAITFEFAASYMRVGVTQAGTGDKFTYEVRAEFMKMS